MNDKIDEKLHDNRDPSEDKNKKEVKKVKDRDIKIKESEHIRLIQENKEAKDKYLRLCAEFDNARKRMERDKVEFVKYANEGLISEFLNIMDDLERSVEAAKIKHQDYEGFLRGIEMVMKRINSMLGKSGVKPIDAKGKKFDPHCHEVLMQEETDKIEEGTVLDELQKGYYLGDRVVRTSKVKLAKKPETISEQDVKEGSEEATIFSDELNNENIENKETE